MSFYNNVEKWTKIGAATDYSTEVFIIDEDYTLQKCVLSTLIDKYKDKANTPFGIRDEFFVEDKNIKQWIFGEERVLYEFQSNEEAKNALKGLEIYAYGQCDIAPPYYTTEEQVYEDLRELGEERA